MKSINGELVVAYEDLCQNYKPNKTKPTKTRSLASEVRGIESGIIYECKNFAKISEKDCEYCLNCSNRREIKDQDEFIKEMESKDIGHILCNILGDISDRVQKMQS